MMDTLLITLQADEWTEAAIRWLEAAEARRGSKRTRNEYEANMRLFMASVSKHPAQITGSDCQRWASDMHQAGLANATIKARLAAVSSFYRFAQRYEVTPGQYLHSFNPASAVQRPSLRTRPRANPRTS
ncbi:MAG: site-specific integrase [Chloroflexi bacterium]|uniref:Site-specific integrase n=1 Tax=Candidatus Chlorohelix allophototropha TaxID=3003348 RepID=A0A8T7MAK9_9CHLR|nr:site-specific integrase [Chloroflexota bacterium]WJW69146.1 site-specific integrase [Chloroflexota bacterium L227-S17]